MPEDARAPQEWCPRAWNERCSHKGHSRSGKRDRIGDPRWEGKVSPHGKLWKCWCWNRPKQGWKSGFQHGKVSCVVCAGGGGAPKIWDVLGWEVLGEGKGIFLPNFYVRGEFLTLLGLWNITEAANPRCCCSFQPQIPSKTPSRPFPGQILAFSLNIPLSKPSWPQWLFPPCSLNSSGFGIPSAPKFPSKPQPGLFLDKSSHSPLNLPLATLSLASVAASSFFTQFQRIFCPWVESTPPAPFGISATG